MKHVFTVLQNLLFFNVNFIIKFFPKSGLSMNILRAGDKPPLQRGFFKNSAGDLLPAQRLPGGLYNACDFVIMFSLM